jgi:hypothetical protein
VLGENDEEVVELVEEGREEEDSGTTDGVVSIYLECIKKSLC